MRLPGALMSVTYIGEMYGRIKDANPMLSVLGLAIAKYYAAGDLDSAEAKKQAVMADYTNQNTAPEVKAQVEQWLDICVMFHRMYTV